MSSPVSVFVAHPATLQSVIDKVERFFGVTLTPMGDEWQGASLGAVGVCVREGHPYESDGDIDFEHYPIEVEFRKGRAAQDPARKFFAALCAEGRYPIMLVDDLQVRMGAFDPTRSAA